MGADVSARNASGYWLFRSRIRLEVEAATVNVVLDDSTIGSVTLNEVKLKIADRKKPPVKPLGVPAGFDKMGSF